MAVVVHQFSCPGCRAHLKIARTPPAVQNLPCPDCKAALRIEFGQTENDYLVTLETGVIQTAIPSRPESADRSLTPKLGNPAGSSAPEKPGEPSQPSVSIPVVPGANRETEQLTPTGKKSKSRVSTTVVSSNNTVQADSEQRPTPVRTRNSAAPKTAPSRKTRSLSWFNSLLAELRSPFGLLLTVAVVVGLVFVAVALRAVFDNSHAESVGSGTTNAIEDPSNATGEIDGALHPKNSSDATGVADDSGNQPSTESPIPDELRQRLERLADRIELYSETESQFPPGEFSSIDLPRAQRLSWLALLADRLPEPDRPMAFFDVPWNDPRNDRFVRRKIPDYLNPAIPSLVGEDGYPTTHFIGLSGVGPAADTVNCPESQRGLFPIAQSVRLDDVHDGLGNTILAVGVDRQLGSWAAGGRATVRSWRGPMLRGESDGFGSGAADSVIVLMADGRVQQISVDVDPNVFARMITIAGELQSNEPSDDISNDPPQPANPASFPDVEQQPEFNADDPDDPPLIPNFAADREFRAKQVDLRLTLAQRVVRYEQPAARRTDVLRDLADLAGAPIRHDRKQLGQLAAALDGQISFSLRNVTVHELIEHVVSQTGLRIRVEQREIWLVPADEIPNKPIPTEN